jgi:hypothetical protein
VQAKVRKIAIGVPIAVVGLLIILALVAVWYVRRAQHLTLLGMVLPPGAGAGTTVLITDIQVNGPPFECHKLSWHPCYQLNVVLLNAYAILLLFLSCTCSWHGMLQDSTTIWETVSTETADRAVNLVRSCGTLPSGLSWRLVV